MVTVALIAYIAATSVGMVVGSMMSFWASVVPAFAGAALAIVAAFLVVDRRSLDISGHEADVADKAVFAGCAWGGLAGALATSTCGPTHKHLFGSHVSAVVVGLVAIALILVADMLPRCIASRPHALCGLLFLSTVGLALALGAEVPRWP